MPGDSGIENLVDSMLFMALLFLLGLAPSLRVDLLEVPISPLSLCPFYVLCFHFEMSPHVVLFVMLSFSKGAFWGHSPPSGGGHGVSIMPFSTKTLRRQIAVMLQPP